MPYNAASGSKSITILAVTLDLTISPSQPWVRGQTITMKAVAKQDTTLIVGTTITFRSTKPVDMPLGSAVTDSTGTATFSHTISDAWGCYQGEFQAYRSVSGTYSNKVSGNIAYPTRLSISAPSSIGPGETFTISGKLEYEASAGVWGGMANKTVTLTYNTTSLGTATTGTDGSYSKSVSIPTTGSYTLKASYAGEGFLAVTAEVPLAIMASVALPIVLPLVVGLLALVATRSRK